MAGKISMVLQYTIDINAPLVVHSPETLLMEGDKNANIFEIKVMDGDQPEDLTGYTVGGSFTRQDGGEVDITGTIEGNVVKATLNEYSYAVAGTFGAYVQLINVAEEIRRTILLVAGYVQPRGHGPIIDTGKPIASLDDIIAQLETMKTVTAETQTSKEAAENAALNANSAASTAQSAASTANTATTNANNATARANTAAQALETAPVPTGTVSTYQAGTSPTTPPTGTWQSTIPAVPQGQYLWTRTVQSYTNGSPTTYYSVARQGMDGSGSVASVNGISPDASGNVELGDIGAVKTVDGVSPDGSGNVPLNAANRDTYMLRLTAEECEARTLARRQQDYADGVRGYLVGSGDSVRCGYVLNEDGTTTPQADPGAVQRGEKVALAADSEMLGGKAPEYYLQPRNLLDNSDFTNPVNQRGFVSGTSGERKYSLDRWILEYDTNLHLHYGYVGISGYWALSQKIGCKLLAGKTYTFAVEAKSEAETGTAFVRLGNPDGTGAKENRQDINASEWTRCWSVWTADKDYEPGEAVFAFGINTGTKLDTQIYFRNPVVYEGTYTADTLPPYVPKGYAIELLACKVAETGNLGGLDMELVWENEAPTSTFDAQDINSVDVRNYIGLLWFLKSWNGTSYIGSWMTIGTNEYQLHTIYAISDKSLITRTLKVNEDGTLTLGIGRSADITTSAYAENAMYAIPVAIYGLEG